MRKIVQIATVPPLYDQRDQVLMEAAWVLALCDDGSLWRANDSDKPTKWYRVMDIPQDNPKESNPDNERT